MLSNYVKERETIKNELKAIFANLVHAHEILNISIKECDTTKFQEAKTYTMNMSNKINEIDPTWKKYKCFKCHGVSGEISLEGKRPLSNRKYKSVKNAFVLMKFKKKFKYSEDNIKEHEPIYNNKITNEDLEKLSYYLGRYQ